METSEGKVANKHRGSQWNNKIVRLYLKGGKMGVVSMGNIIRCQWQKTSIQPSTPARIIFLLFRFQFDDLMQTIATFHFYTDLHGSQTLTLPTELSVRSGGIQYHNVAPQWMVLSPILFTLYTSDFQYNSEQCVTCRISLMTLVLLNVSMMGRRQSTGQLCWVVQEEKPLA